MMSPKETVFRLAPALPPRWQNPLTRGACQLIEKASGLDRLQQRYQVLPQTSSVDEFLGRVTDALDVGLSTVADEVAHIPRQGKAVLVANHPYGGIEGVLLAQMLRRIRPDVRILANALLSRIDELSELLIPVDPFGGANAARANLKPLREAIRWVDNGGLLLVFPAGEVSHLHLRQRDVLDPEWSPTIGRIVRRTKAPVVPLFLHGRNRALFQLTGLLHPRLRTMLLPRELLNMQGKTVSLRIGAPLTYAKKLERFEDDRRLIDYLRLQSYRLESKPAMTTAEEVCVVDGQGLIEPVAPHILQGEIARLPAHQRLDSSGAMTVYQAEAEQIPHLLVEIGRLREQTFRSAGEGTGQPVDLDRFDRNYLHLFIWHEEHQQIVGAYRVGRTDRLMTDKGLHGLYTSTLFDYRREFLESLGPALELGRSFVREEYQRSYAPLLLLWKGIGAYVVKNPRYRYLFGPVSISRDYSDLSRHLMATSLLTHEREESLAKLVRPKNPLRLKKMKIPGSRGRNTEVWGQDLDELAALVDGLEGDKSIPVLLRHYLGMGGKLLAFNVDKDFASVLDGLILVDLMKTEQRQLKRYLGQDGANAFIAYQQSCSHLWDACA